MPLTNTTVNKDDVDFGKHAIDYAMHRAGFSSCFYKRLEDLKILHSDFKLLDLGTGTGTIARSMAQKGYNVTGTDPSENLNNRT